MYLYWQSSLMQAEGGMDHIPRAFENNLGPNTQIQLNKKADRHQPDSGQDIH